MGKPVAKKKKHPSSGKMSDANTKHNHTRSVDRLKVFDEDTTIFIDMSNDMKEDGNKLFQKRDYEGAILKYEKAIKLLPKSHIDVAYLRSNLAACYMQMGPEEYHNAINECNLALEVSPKYTKALLKRARCYEALNRLEAAYRDIDFVLRLEPNNLTALEISDRVKKAMEKKGIKLDDKAMIPPTDVLVVKEKKKKKSHKADKVDKVEKPVDKVDESLDKVDNAVDKVIVEVNKCNSDLNVDPVKKEEPVRVVKLVFGEDIRVALIPVNCSILQLRDVVGNRFPSLRAVLIKYKDKEGDLVTITTSEELRLAEQCAGPLGSVRIFISEVDPEHEPFLGEGSSKGSEVHGTEKNLNSFSDNGSSKQDEERTTSICVANWIVQFARLFQNHVGFSSDCCLDLHDLGMKLYAEAMEDAVTGEEAQEIFATAAGKFQEMAALALFNWGNVHMSRARKRVFLSDDAPREAVLEQVKTAYEWAQEEYVQAGKRYEEALKIKPDFYEALLALGQQQFEQAKLSWYYAIGSKVDLDTWPSTEVLELFNNAEENMERGTEMWEEMEEQRIKNLSQPNKEKELLEKMGLDGFLKDISSDEAADQASNMQSQINLLWGTMLYERSIVEYNLGYPIYEDCLMAAVEKFKLAGASPTDLAVMIKNHAANETALEGLNFKIDEIVQAWNEMYDAKRWMSGVPSFRLEPLFRRRVPKLHSTLENI